MYSVDSKFVANRVLRRPSLLVLAILILSSAASFAVSLAPEVVERMRQEGTLDEYVNTMNDARARGVDAPSSKPYRFTLSAEGAQDTVRLVVLLVDFRDNQWTDGPDGTADYFRTLLFSDSTLSTGSMREYYLANSVGKFVIEGEVHGWFRMPQSYTYYTNGEYGLGYWSYPNNAQKLAEDAVSVADANDPTLDFKYFDTDNNGWVTDLIIVHAGEGHETSGNDNHIHSHRWSMASESVADDVHLRDYTMQPEQGASQTLITIGVFCHEYGHILGLPDLYDVSYATAGLGNWSVMASGSYNGGGKTPANFDAWCRKEMGFIAPIAVRENTDDFRFPQSEDSANCFAVWRNGVYSNQYFLIENRQKVGFDAALPGEGLMIYHIDEGQGDNEYPGYIVALEQADGQNRLLSPGSYNYGDSGDPYPGSTNNHEFSDRTNPNSRGNAGTVTEVGLFSISPSATRMAADIEVAFGRPYVGVNSLSFTDSSGNSDGVLQLGEIADVYFQIQSNWADAANVTGTLQSSDGRLQITNPTVSIGTVTGRGGIGGNQGEPFKFTIPEDMDSSQVTFTLTADCDDLSDEVVYTVRQTIGGAKVLIVDDDTSSTNNYVKTYTDALDSLNYSYSVWRKATQGTPGYNELRYPMMIWFTGDSRSSTLTQADRQFIKQYLDYGGGLLLTGQDVAEHLSLTEPMMLTTYFHCSYAGAPTNVVLVRGAPSSVFDGDSIFVSVPDGAMNQWYPDALAASDPSSVCFTYMYGETAGVQVTGSAYRAVLLGFGFEGISDSYYESSGFKKRHHVLDQALSFLNGRPQAPNRPPSDFELVSPVDGDTVQDGHVALVWRKSIDIDPFDAATYTVQYDAGDTTQWDVTIPGIADTQYTASGMTKGSFYTWKVTAADKHGASISCGAPGRYYYAGDITAPRFVFYAIPNPLLPFELDLYAYPSEQLNTAPTATVTPPSGSHQTVGLSSLTGHSAITYVLDYQIVQSGYYEFSVCGIDTAGNTGCGSKSVAAAQLTPYQGASISGKNRIVSIEIPRTESGSGIVLLDDDPTAGGSAPAGLADDQMLLRFDIKSSVDLPTGAELRVDLNRLGLGDQKYKVALSRVDDAGAIEISGSLMNDDVASFALSEPGSYVIARSDKAIGTSTGAMIPSHYQLHQNRPNPFNGSTAIAFELPAAGMVKLSIFNLLGQQVVTLVDSYLGVGSHEADWNGRDSRGEECASGIYFYRIETSAFTQTKRLVLLK